MKKLMCIITLLVASLTASAQDVSFVNTESGLIVRIVQECPNMQALYKAVKISPFVTDAEKVDSTLIVGKLSVEDIDYEGAGFTRMRIPIYLSGNKIRGQFYIDYKSGKYRVTIYNMTLVAKDSSSASLYGYSTPIEDYTDQSGQLDSYITPILGRQFSRYFSYTFESEDW